MENRGHIAKQLRRVFKAIEHVVRFDVVDEAKRDEIFPFLVLTKKIANENVIDTTAIQFPDYCATDETCAARDEYSAFREISHVLIASLLRLC